MDTIYVYVEYSTEDEEANPVYVASNDDLMFTTDSQTFEELIQNVREVIALCLYMAAGSKPLPTGTLRSIYRQASTYIDKKIFESYFFTA